MREFAKAGTMARMPRLSLAAVPLLVGCTSPEYQAWQEENAKYASSGRTSGDAGTTGELPAGSTGDDDAATGSRLRAEVAAIVGTEGPSAAQLEAWRHKFPPPMRGRGKGRQAKVTTVIDDDEDGER